MRYAVTDGVEACGGTVDDADDEKEEEEEEETKEEGSLRWPSGVALDRWGGGGVIGAGACAAITLPLLRCRCPWRHRHRGARGVEPQRPRSSVARFLRGGSTTRLRLVPIAPSPPPVGSAAASACPPPPVLLSDYPDGVAWAEIAGTTCRLRVRSRCGPRRPPPPVTRRERRPIPPPAPPPPSNAVSRVLEPTRRRAGDSDLGGGTVAFSGTACVCAVVWGGACAVLAPAGGTLRPALLLRLHR